MLTAGDPDTALVERVCGSNDVLSPATWLDPPRIHPAPGIDPLRIDPARGIHSAPAADQEA